jgi:hypothetical protein
MDHMFRRQPISSGDLRLSRPAPMESSAFFQQLFSRRPVDRAVNSASAKQSLIGGVDDGVRRKGGDISANHFDSHSPHLISKSLR